MFWIVVFVVAGISFAALPIAHFSAYLLSTVVSTASVVAAAHFLIGKVTFAAAFKANMMATLTMVVGFMLIYSVLGRSAWLMFVLAFFLALWAGLFIYAKYLEASMPHALVVSIAAAMVNGMCMWFIERTIELRISATMRMPEHPELQTFIS